jgi:peptidoglycan hydrolase-like protein with peptidoglycan-binding domain
MKKKVVCLVLVLAMVMAFAGTAFADSSYPNYNWRYRMQLQQQGANNAQVGAIQRILQQLNYGITVDWIFGSITKSKVKSFQTSESLTSDGIVGGQTWQALQSHLTWTRRDSNGFDYYKVVNDEYFAHGPDGTWWLLTDSGTYTVIR